MIRVLMGARARNLRGKPFNESQQVEGDCTSAIAPVATQAIDHATVGGEREPATGDGGAGNIAA